MTNWADHCTTIFPEVRLKQFLEMRGADSGPQSRISGLQALWAGIFYDNAALNAAWDLCKGWSVEECERWLAPVLNYDPLRMNVAAE